MMYIAAMTEGPGADGIVAPVFADAGYLLILDGETGEVTASYARGGMDDCDLAGKIVEHDCEAVLCGPIEEDPFIIIADEGCVTRYQAGGLTAREALRRMNAYQLEMIPDFIGGTGCGSGQESNCCHSHGDEDE